MDRLSLVLKFSLLAALIAVLSIATIILWSESAILIKLALVLFDLLLLLLILYLAAKTRDNLLYFSTKSSQITSGNLDSPLDRKLTSEFAKTEKDLEKMRLVLRDRINILTEEKNRAEAVVFSVGEGVFAVNLKGEIIIFNQVAEKLVGMKRDVVLGQRYDQLLQFFNSKTKANLGQFINTVLLEGKSTNLPDNTVIITSNKAEIPVAVNSSPIRNEKKIIVGAIVVFRDITREKEIEEIRTDLISIASHQLRTPLSEIKGLVSLLSDNIAGPLNQKQEEYLNLLEIANNRMINLVDDLLNVSRIEQGRIQLNFQKVNLGKLAQEIQPGLLLRAAEKKQTLSLTLDPNLPPVMADPEKTKEVISNLIENALKYTYPNGTIAVRVTANTTGVWVLVADNGVGIPKAKQKNLFQKFSRVENPLSKTISGTGLGLYTVKQLVERQNGQVLVKSEEGKGSTFSFVLPVAK